MDATTAALVGVGIGVVGGGIFGSLTSWATNRWQIKSAREARSEERRAAAYFDVFVFGPVCALFGATRPSAVCS